MSDTQEPNLPENTDDLWGQAMAEHQAMSGEQLQNVDEGPVFKPLEDAESVQVSAREIAMLRDIPVDLTVELGKTRMTIGKLLEIVQGSVIELDSLVGEPMDVKINGHFIAKCEVMNSDNRFAIRINSIVTPGERAERLAGIN